MKNRLIKAILVSMFAFFLSAFQLTALHDSIFKEKEEIIVNTGETVFAGIVNVTPVKAGYLLLIQRRVRSDIDMILKVDQTGKIVARIDQKGFGPGEVNALRNIMVTKDHVYAIEVMTFIVHQYDHDLKFIRDYRINRSGRLVDLGKYFAILGLTRHQDNEYALSLYDKPNFDFKGYAFVVDNPPLLVRSMGGVCKMERDAFAVAYSNQHRVRLFNADLEIIGQTPKVIPPHIKQYTPYPNDRSNVDNRMVNWSFSFAKMQDIFYVNENFLVVYKQEHETFIDIYDRKGNVVLGNYKLQHESGLDYFDGNYFYNTRTIEIDDEFQRHYIYKLELVLPQKSGK